MSHLIKIYAVYKLAYFSYLDWYLKSTDVGISFLLIRLLSNDCFCLVKVGVADLEADNYYL